jgi:hypothetical protein
VGRAYLKARAVRPTLLGALRRQRVRLTYTRVTEPHEPVAEGFVDTAFEQVSVLTRATATLAAVALVGGVTALVLLSRSGPRDDIAPSGLAAPTTPVDFQARPGGPGIVKLSWQPVNGAKSYGLYLLDGDRPDAPRAEVKEVKAPLTVKEWENLSPDKAACFVVTALNDGGQSDPSDVQCSPAGRATEPRATATEGTTSPGPTATETGATAREPQGSYAVVEFIPKDDAVKTAGALARKREIDTIIARYGYSFRSVLADVDASTRLSAEYRDARVIYVDGFRGGADAEDFCARVKPDLPDCVPSGGAGQGGGRTPPASMVPAPPSATPSSWVTSEPEPLGGGGNG